MFPSALLRHSSNSAGRDVYHLEEFTVFGNVKGSPQRQQMHKLHSVLWHQSISACRNELKCFNMLARSVQIKGFQALQRQNRTQSVEPGLRSHCSGNVTTCDTSSSLRAHKVIF